ncbi:SpoIIE family protein phosphatase [Nocardioides perillae]|uniref:Serine phosphatase RsbU (Regulator of sigma subunit) n=1 Tax=Nocardioides perillae TaxID=1119534 RepID=A0A7Y9RXU2_9ACTN|nr:serine phosphatase RsbU (regulator of sigma subunit) [Nocardioides perillae]
MDTLFATAGSLREAYAAVAWERTPLGAPEGWSPCLRQSVRTVLDSRFPMTLMWGPQFVLVYNEAYVELIGDKHPAALGATSREVFPEAWEQIGPWMSDVLTTGEGHYVEDALVPLERHGFLEECYFTFSYSAVRSSGGVVEGVLDIAAETTPRVVERRRQQVVAELAYELGAVDTLEEVPAVVARVVAESVSPDLSAAALRLPQLAPGPGHREPSDGLPPTPDDLLPALDPLVVRDDEGEGATGFLVLPAGRLGRDRAVLVARLGGGRAPDAAYRSFLRQVGGVVDQAVERMRVVAAEREVARRERGLSEALQRSLLTDLPEVEGLDLAVRYVPAAEVAFVGGDWYDAFPTPDGSLAVVIGDVAGHDRDAAAAMGQARNLLRGIAYAVPGGPGAVLTTFDEVFERLAVSSVATVVLGHVTRHGDGGATLCWANAGHPPPVLVSSDGSARLLEVGVDPLLGLAPGRERSDHEVRLEPGSTLVLYTDGLVERRGVGLDLGLAWLVGQLDAAGATAGTTTAEDVCELLATAVPAQAEDDIALLVLRVPG